MRFHRHGDRYIAMAITPRRHNFLSLRFGDAAEVRVWSPMRDSAEKLRVHIGDVKTQVLAGVDEVNRTTGAAIRVSHVQFLESDSPSRTIYREMARRITLRYLADPERFDGVEDDEPGGPGQGVGRPNRGDS